MKIKEVSSAIIAGGKSRRFGSPKYQATFGGKTLIQYSVQLAQKLSEQLLVIANDPELQTRFNLPVFPDLIPNKGPLGGILTALTKMQTKWLFILPVDMPLLKPEIYFQLWQQRTDAKPVVATSSKGIESMVSLWHQSHRPFVEQLIKQGQLKINLALKELGAVQVPFGQEADFNFFNINFKEDIEKLEQIARERRLF